jgi:eukaryotic translation initiation factor 2C
VLLNESKKDIITDIEAGFKELLIMHYNEMGKKKPDRIVYYRDGVSDAEFPEILKKELQVIQNVCLNLDPESGWCPEITMVIVQKRHHVRFFQQDGSKLDNPKSGNAAPGHVVDRGITHPKLFDFYLLSHAGIQGTSRPTKYTVLADGSNFSSDEIQQLTYNLCWLYQRCTRAVSIPTPVYYAHLAAARARGLYVNAKEDGQVSHEYGALKKVKSEDSEPSLNVFQGIHTNMHNRMYFC